MQREAGNCTHKRLCSLVSSEFLSRYFEIELHPMDNTDEIKYREEIQPQEEMFNHPQRWIKNMRKEKLKIPLILKKKGIEFRGRILEIGAGSCWFSSVLSKFPEVKEVYALDFSKHILTKVAPAMMDYLNADSKKIVRVRGSFYNLIRLGKKFDFVVADETLHHADYPIKLLNGIGNVLKQDGRIVFIREPIASRMPILGSVNKRISGSRERKYGVTENIYTLNEWYEIFQKANFDVTCYFLRLTSKYRLARASWFSRNIPSVALNIIYGVDSMPIAFIGKKRTKC